MLKIDNKIYLSWDDVQGLVDKLCEKIITELFDYSRKLPTGLKQCLLQCPVVF